MRTFVVFTTFFIGVSHLLASDNGDCRHEHRYIQGNYVLRSPSSPEEWDEYHKIRLLEIHNLYCPDKPYNKQDEEEQKKGNFPFILLDQSHIVGTIRVDILGEKEASLRWVAIAQDYQRKGLGTILLALSEQFARDQGCILLRVPAEKESREFYVKRGYLDQPWPNGPEDSGDIPLAKKL